MQGTFQEVLAAAIADMTDNGFDSVERIERWTRELRDAAERSMVSPESLDMKLRDALATIYRRLVDKGGIVKYNPGVERFTIDRIKPALRSELDRRIAASANLIRLNRTQAIEKTLQRFQGWATSVPPGGVSGESRKVVRENTRKSLASLPFEERRVLIDQGHKLVGAINEIVAMDGGAIAGRWRSHWRQAGYNYRKDHRERDGEVYLIRDSWAHQTGLVKKGRAGYVDDVTQPGQEIFCRCYYTYLYNLRDLPEDMLTAKGRAALQNVRGQEEVRSARTARADSIDPTAPARVEIAIPVPVDRDHDVAAIFHIQEGGARLYVDRSLPRTVDVGGVWFDPAAIGWEREYAAWTYRLKMVSAFIDQFGRHPGPEETAGIQEMARAVAREAEVAVIARIGVDWDAWEAWSRGEVARLERRRASRPPPDMRAA